MIRACPEEVDFNCLMLSLCNWVWETWTQILDLKLGLELIIPTSQVTGLQGLSLCLNACVAIHNATTIIGWRWSDFFPESLVFWQLKNWIFEDEETRLKHPLSRNNSWFKTWSTDSYLSLV